MLSGEHKNRFWPVKKISSSVLCWLVASICLACCYGLARQVPSIESEEINSQQPEAVRLVCELIYEGKFTEAGELIEQSAPEQQATLGKLGEIVQQYQTIAKQRQAAQKAAYEEQLAELQKLKAPADANQAKDANDVQKVLSVIAKTSEFADDQQKAELLSSSFVTQTIEKAKTEASQLASKGKWLDAYIMCYSWLEQIDKTNQDYSDYTEKLLEKANIAASFQDSPCETSKERYEGVKKQMFKRAFDALNYNYVSIIDYRQVAIKAIKRCKLLAEVMGSMPSEVSKDQSSLSVGENSEKFFSPPDSQKLRAWSAVLTATMEEVSQSPTGMSKDKFIDTFEDILKMNEATIEISPQVLIAQFAEAALSALDPHTAIIWPKQIPDFQKTMTNEFTGIGIEISKRKGLLTVVSLLPDTPAYCSGLDAGDVIEKVDSIETKGMTLMCAVRTITGPKGTNVTLTVRTVGEDETRDITITRDRIIVPPIRGWQRTETGSWRHMIDEQNKIGYVRITGFDTRTAAYLENALTELEEDGLRGLVIDLRYNSGGLLPSAIEVTDKFIKEGLIVRTAPRFGMADFRHALKKGTHPDYPLVILVNNYSASASEIVAGALADKVHNRAILVGERTHGKGSVQVITNHPGDGAQLKYTMAYYYLPSGQRVESRDAMKKLGRDDWGVTPNIEVKLKSNERIKMFDARRGNEVLVKADHNNNGEPVKKLAAEETLTADLQLAVAVLVIKTKLIQSEALVSSVN